MVNERGRDDCLFTEMQAHKREREYVELKSYEEKVIVLLEEWRRENKMKSSIGPINNNELLNESMERKMERVFNAFNNSLIK